jgi:hypothetical protein
MLYQYTTPRSCAEVSLPNASPVRENPETHTTLSATVKRLLVFMLIRLWHLSPDLGAAAGRLVVRYWPPFRGA